MREAIVFATGAAVTICVAILLSDWAMREPQKRGR
jgi:hypothetical protein